MASHSTKRKRTLTDEDKLKARTVSLRAEQRSLEHVAAVDFANAKATLAKLTIVRSERRHMKSLIKYAKPLDWSTKIGKPWFRKTPFQHHVNQVFTALILGIGHLTAFFSTGDFCVDPELMEEILESVNVYETQPNFGPERSYHGFEFDYKGDRRPNAFIPGVSHPFGGKGTLSWPNADTAIGFISGNVMHGTYGPYSGMMRFHNGAFNHMINLQYHGEGSVVFHPDNPNGYTYNANDCKYSKATNTGRELTKFVGIWNRDMAVSGVVTFLCGATYTGKWKNGTSDGSGIYSHPCRHSLNVAHLSTDESDSLSSWACKKYSTVY